VNKLLIALIIIFVSFVTLQAAQDTYRPNKQTGLPDNIGKFDQYSRALNSNSALKNYTGTFYDYSKTIKANEVIAAGPVIDIRKILLDYGFVQHPTSKIWYTDSTYTTFANVQTPLNTYLAALSSPAVLRAPAATYYVSGSIILRSDLEFIGDGPEVSVFRINSSVHNTLPGGGGVFYASGKANIAVKNLGIEGRVFAGMSTSVISRGMFFVNMSTLYVDNVHVNGTPGNNIQVYSTTQYGSKNINISNSELTDAGDGNLALTNVQGGTIDNNKMVGNGTGCINASGSLSGYGVEKLLITKNYLSKSVSPTRVAIPYSGSEWGGFVTFYNQGNQYNTVSHNIMYDNYNTYDSLPTLSADG